MKSIVLCDEGDTEQVLKLCEKYHVGIELQGLININANENPENFIKKNLALLPKGIEKHLHAPFWDLNLGSCNHRIVQVTRYFFDYAYEAAKVLGCQSITVHHGYVPNTTSAVNTPSWIRNSAKFWQDFFAAHNDGILMCMENQLEQSADPLVGVIDAAAQPYLGVNLDVGHANCYSGEPVLTWISKLGDRIKYVHLHQNYGDDDDHLGLSEGSMPLHEILTALNRYAPDAIWALECQKKEESLAYLAEHGFMA